MAFIQAPIAHDGNPQTVSRIQCQIRSVNGAALQGGVYDIGKNIGLAQQFAAVARFFFAFFCQSHIDPTSELIGRIPLTLTMPQKNQLSSSHGTDSATLRRIVPYFGGKSQNNRAIMRRESVVNNSMNACGKGHRCRQMPASMLSPTRRN